MTQYVDLPSNGGLRLTVREAQALVDLVGDAIWLNKESLWRARTKLRIAIEDAPLDGVNKRITATAKHRAAMTKTGKRKEGNYEHDHYTI